MERRPIIEERRNLILINRERKWIGLSTFGCESILSSTLNTGSKLSWLFSLPSFGTIR